MTIQFEHLSNFGGLSWKR